MNENQATLREVLIGILEEFDPGGWYQDPRIDDWVLRLEEVES